MRRRASSSEMSTPRFDRDAPFTVSPGQIAFDGGLLFFVGSVIRCFQGELFQGGELTFDTVEPRGIGWCQVESHIVLFRPTEHLGLEVWAIVVHDDVQRFFLRVAAANPFKERQKLGPPFL